MIALLKTRVRLGIVASIQALGLQGFDAANVVMRKTQSADNLATNAVIVSPARANRLTPLTAGQRMRTIRSAVGVWFTTKGDDALGQTDQENILENIEALFDSPIQFPAGMIAQVGGYLSDMRVASLDEYWPLAVRGERDVHRMIVETDVCQDSGEIA